MYDPSANAKIDAALARAAQIMQRGIASFAAALLVQAQVASLLQAQPGAADASILRSSAARAVSLLVEQTARAGEAHRARDEIRTTKVVKQIINVVQPWSFDHWIRGEPLSPQKAKTSNASLDYWSRGEPFRGFLPA